MVGEKYPNIEVPLTDEDGNAEAMIGRTARALRRNGVSEAEIDVFKAEATSGDYGKVLSTITSWVSTC